MADAIRTAPRKHRVFYGPAITFAIAEEMSLLERGPEWLSGTRNLEDSELLLTIVREVK